MQETKCPHEKMKTVEEIKSMTRDLSITCAARPVRQPYHVTDHLISDPQCASRHISTVCPIPRSKRSSSSLRAPCGRYMYGEKMCSSPKTIGICGLRVIVHLLSGFSTIQHSRTTSFSGLVRRAPSQATAQPTKDFTDLTGFLLDSCRGTGAAATRQVGAHRQPPRAFLDF